jgi:hypothetical protein
LEINGWEGFLVRPAEALGANFSRSASVGVLPEITVRPGCRIEQQEDGT